MTSTSERVSVETLDVRSSDAGLATPPPAETPLPSPKLKGRKRLLHGLQRISSSQSLLRLHKSHSSGYRTGGKGSMSCISLASSSASPYQHSFTPSPFGSNVSNGYSTAPTTVPSTPGDVPFVEPKVRPVNKAHPPGLSPLSASVPLEATKLGTRPATSAGVAARLPPDADYFSQPLSLTNTKSNQLPKHDFDFWQSMPAELRGDILRLLKPREIISCSRVSKSWYDMCFDGQLWATLDTASFYQHIPADALAKIITRAGPFARDLNLRGCVQLWDRWRDSNLPDVCTNLQNISLDGCRIDRSAVHSLFYSNSNLVHINVQGLHTIVSNSTLKIIGQHCPLLQYLNVNWCYNVCSKGLRKVVEGCSDLRELRAGEVRGMGDQALMRELFRCNTLESLVLMGCDSLTDDALTTLLIGAEDVERDYLTGHALVSPRKLRHLDLSRCRQITDSGLLSAVAVLPALEGLQLSKCHALTDVSLIPLLKTLPSLTHLDLEELDALTNATLSTLASSPCAPHLKHLSISYCEHLGDVGMLPVIKSCPSLTSLELDNTRISDLVLVEAAAQVRSRAALTGLSTNLTGTPIPKVGLLMVVYDCQNVTWTGIREVLSRNAENRAPPPAPRRTGSPRESLSRPFSRPLHPKDIPVRAEPVYPTQLISLKTFYGYQPTVTEHMRRCLSGEFERARRLERKWAEYMIASEEAGAPGGFGPGGFGLFSGVLGRRRRRRVREAMMGAGEEVDGTVVGRRRARSGGAGGGVASACTIM